MPNKEELALPTRLEVYGTASMARCLSYASSLTLPCFMSTDNDNGTIVILFIDTLTDSYFYIGQYIGITLNG